MPSWEQVTTTSHPLGRWIYTRYATGEVELYDLADDPWQLHNVAGDPAVAGIETVLRYTLVGIPGDPYRGTRPEDFARSRGR